MKVIVLTTSYPRSPEDVAGRFVADAVDRVLAAGVEVEVVSPARFRHFGIAYGGGIVNNGTSANHQYFNNPRILGNSVFDNTSDGSVPDRGLGIDLVSNSTGLGPDPNRDQCEAPNNPQQNFPILEEATAGDATLTIRGHLNGMTFTSQRSQRVEFFSSPSCDC